MSWQSISKNACSSSKVTPSKSFSTPELFFIVHDYRREELWETLRQGFLRWVLEKNNKSCLWLKSIEVRAKRWMWERGGDCVFDFVLRARAVRSEKPNFGYSSTEFPRASGSCAVIRFEGSGDEIVPELSPWVNCTCHFIKLLREAWS